MFRRKDYIKLLIVCSGNSPLGINPIVQNQGDSLKGKEIDLCYFTILGKGTTGYLKNIPLLRRFLLTNNYDLIHAHYSLSSIVASLSCKLPMVVSLMGSDTHINILWKFVINAFYKFRWKATIVKSMRMKRNIGLKNAMVIPNGVNFSLFKPIDKNISKIKIGFNSKKRYIIFVANSKRPEKNYLLAERSVELINNDSVELKIVSDVEHNVIPYYMNAADILLLTSLWEGSPNVIKEAMACNCPIVSTDVGDVKEIIGDTEGCYICSYDHRDVADKIKLALDFGKRTNGREKIKHLDEKIIATKIIAIYKQVLDNSTT